MEILFLHGILLLTLRCWHNLQTAFFTGLQCVLTLSFGRNENIGRSWNLFTCLHEEVILSSVWIETKLWGISGFNCCIQHTIKTSGLHPPSGYSVIQTLHKLTFSSHHCAWQQLHSYSTSGVVYTMMSIKYNVTHFWEPHSIQRMDSQCFPTWNLIVTLPPPSFPISCSDFGCR